MTPYDSFIAQSGFLSLEAKALYFYIRTLPTNILPKKALLAKELRIGRNRTTRAVSELRNLGLIAHYHIRDSKGRICGEEMLFVPQDQHTAFRYAGKQKN